MKTLACFTLLLFCNLAWSQVKQYESHRYLFHSNIAVADSFSTIKKLEEFPPLEEVNNFPTICPEFNTIGQKACLRYVIDRGLFELEEFYGFTNFDSFTGRVYFLNGKPNALRLLEPPFSKQTAETAWKRIQDYFQLEIQGIDFQEMDSFFITVEFNKENIFLQESTSPQETTVLTNYFQRKLKSLKSKGDTAAYLHTLKRASAFIFSPLDTTRASENYTLQNLALMRLHTDTLLKFDDNEIHVSGLFPTPSATARPDTLVENVPVFPGCEKAKGNDQLRQCFQYQLMMLVAKTFNFPSEARMKNIQGRGCVSFVYTKEGKASNLRLVKAVHPLIDLEYIRVVSLFPDLDTPAQQRGENVAMSFTLPINAKLQ